MEVKASCFIIKFGTKEDRDRILSMAPWLFDQHILSMLPYIKYQEWATYDFKMVSFWVRVFNIPMELMGCKVAMEIRGAIGKVLAIDSWTLPNRCVGWPVSWIPRGGR